MPKVSQSSCDSMHISETFEETAAVQENKQTNFKFKAGVYLASVTGISVLVGFGSAVAAAKKKDPAFFNRGMAGSRDMAETGSALAMRALGWGTLYAFGGCGLLFYGLWKLSGANNFQEFRLKMGSLLPRIPKNNPPQGRTEFEGLTDLLTYISSVKEDKSSSASES